MRVEIRPYPYPYKAAFSFCNDPDLMTKERYLFLKDLFQNFPASSPSSQASLPYCESFFVFNENPYHPEQISLQSHPDLLIPDVESGYFGVLHSWGDFNFNPVFTRDYARRGFEMLEKLKKKPNVWVNHGTLHNLQNIGAGRGYGDAKEYIDGSGLSYQTKEYHLDYTRLLGIDFYWLDDLTLVAGQNVKLTAKMLWEAQSRNQINSKEAKKLLKKLTKRYFYLPIKTKNTPNSLLREKELRDGSKIFEFVRFGSHDLATADDLMKIIPPKLIDSLIEKEGVMVFYTHLAKTAMSPDKMCDDSLEVLKYLKERYDSGDLWICRVDKLLEYEMIRDSLNFRVQGDQITITEFSNEVKGNIDPLVEKLSGLCFYCNCPEKVKIYYKNKLLALQLNSKDKHGKPSVTIVSK